MIVPRVFSTRTRTTTRTTRPRLDPRDDIRADKPSDSAPTGLVQQGSPRLLASTRDRVLRTHDTDSHSGIPTPRRNRRGHRRHRWPAHRRRLMDTRISTMKVLATIVAVIVWLIVAVCVVDLVFPI